MTSAEGDGDERATLHLSVGLGIARGKRAAEEERPLDEGPSDEETGLTPRVSCALLVSSPHAPVPRIAESMSPRQSAVAGRTRREGTGTSAKLAEVPSPFVLDAPLTPAKGEVALNEDGGWHTVPVRRRRASRRVQPCEASGAVRSSLDWGDDSDGEDLPYTLFVSSKTPRNPRGKHSNQFKAELKRKYAIDKRNAQRGGAKR